MEAELKGKQVTVGVTRHAELATAYDGTVESFNEEFLVLVNARIKSLASTQFKKVYINRNAIYSIHVY